VKLPRLWRKTAPEAADPDPGPAESAAASPAAAAALQVTAYAKSGLPDEEFRAQTAALRRILSYDGDSRSWYGSLALDHPERAAEVLTALFETARVHGATVRIRAPATDDGPSGQVS
jgi:hypothetical protein